MQFHVYARAIAFFGVATLMVNGKEYELIVETAKDDWGGTNYWVGYEISGIELGRPSSWPKNGFKYFDNDKNNYKAGSVETWLFELPKGFHSISTLRVHHKYACCSMFEGWTTQKIQIKDVSSGEMIEFADDRRNIDRDEVHTFYVENCVAEQWQGWSKCDGGCSGGSRERYRFVTSTNGRACMSTEKNNCKPVGAWGQWSSCSAICGAGTRKRKRAAEPATARVCEQLKETEKCVTAGPWQEWGTCAAECGSGLKTRFRTVNAALNPETTERNCPSEEQSSCFSIC